LALAICVQVTEEKLVVFARSFFELHDFDLYATRAP